MTTVVSPVSTLFYHFSFPHGNVNCSITSFPHSNDNCSISLAFHTAMTTVLYHWLSTQQWQQFYDQLSTQHNSLAFSNDIYITSFPHSNNNCSITSFPYSNDNHSITSCMGNCSITSFPHSNDNCSITFNSPSHTKQLTWCSLSTVHLTQNNSPGASLCAVLWQFVHNTWAAQTTFPSVSWKCPVSEKATNWFVKCWVTPRSTQLAHQALGTNAESKGKAAAHIPERVYYQQGSHSMEKVLCTPHFWCSSCNLTMVPTNTAVSHLTMPLRRWRPHADQFQHFCKYPQFLMFSESTSWGWYENVCLTQWLVIIWYFVAWRAHQLSHFLLTTVKTVNTLYLLDGLDLLNEYIIRQYVSTKQYSTEFGKGFFPLATFSADSQCFTFTAPVQSHGSTTVHLLKIPNTGSCTGVWTHENTANTGRNGYCYSCGCCSFTQIRWPNFPQRIMKY